MGASPPQSGRRSMARRALALSLLLVLPCLAMGLSLASAAEAPPYRVVKVYDPAYQAACSRYETPEGRAYLRSE